MDLRRNSRVLFVITVCCWWSGGSARRPSRKKRYVAFPEGAAFSAVVCMTAQMGITDGATIFSEGINWGLTYDLPNDTLAFLDYNKAVAKRRHRRDLYGKMEGILDSMGYNGRACILRTVCEAGKILQPKEDSLAHQILSIIFRFPRDEVQAHEPDDHRVYHWAAGFDEEACHTAFRCPFSLLDVILGYYSESGF